MRSYYDVVVAATSMAAVGIVFGFLAGVVANSEAVAAIAFLLTGATFALSGPAHRPRTITFIRQIKILKGNLR